MNLQGWCRWYGWCEFAKVYVGGVRVVVGEVLCQGGVEV